MVREPTVEQIVDRVLALNYGEKCAITLNPRITRISNLEWLLPICVEQFGTRITVDQQAQGPNVVFMITATQSRKHFVRERVVGEQPASVEVRERVVGEQFVSIDEHELTSEPERKALAMA